LYRHCPRKYRQTIFTVPGTHHDAACEADADPGTLLVLAGLPPRNSEARPLPIWCQIPRNSRLTLLRNSAFGTLASGARAGGVSFLPPALHRGRNAQSFAIFGNRAPRDVHAIVLQALDDLVVGQYAARGLGLDYLFDAVAHGFGRVGVAFAGSGDCRG